MHRRGNNLHLLHPVAFNLQGTQDKIANLNLFSGFGYMLEILHQQAGDGVIFALIIERQGNVLD